MNYLTTLNTSNSTLFPCKFLESTKISQKVMNEYRVARFLWTAVYMHYGQQIINLVTALASNKKQHSTYSLNTTLTSTLTPNFNELCTSQ